MNLVKTVKAVRLKDAVMHYVILPTITNNIFKGKRENYTPKH